MTTFLIRRLLASIIVIVGVVTLVFAAVRAAPGDPVESILGEQALQVDKDNLRACMDLVDLQEADMPAGNRTDAYVASTYGSEAYLVSAGEVVEDGSQPIKVAVPVPIHEQYVRFLGDIGNGTLGELCDEKGVTVVDKLKTNIPPTFQLALASLALALLIAIPLGMASALKPYSWIDNSSAVLALLGISIPNFWLGPMLLILFSLTLKALPEPRERGHGHIRAHPAGDHARHGASGQAHPHDALEHARGPEPGLCANREGQGTAALEAS